MHSIQDDFFTVFQSCKAWHGPIKVKASRAHAHKKRASSPLLAFDVDMQKVAQV